MNDLMPKPIAEQIREQIKLNKVQVRQISNIKAQPSFTDIPDYRSNIKSRYIDPLVFRVGNEIVIFENIVAIYRKRPEVSYLEICDVAYADMMRDLFNNLWKVSGTMVVGIEGGKKSRQYKPISTTLYILDKLIPINIYAVKGERGLENVFKRNEHNCIESYVNDCINNNLDLVNGSDMLIIYLWNDGKDRMMDLWSVTRNHISDQSGLLYTCTTIRELRRDDNMGTGSGDSSIVITAEELLLRELILEKGLSFTEAADRKKYMPKFPVGMKPKEEFYT